MSAETLDTATLKDEMVAVYPPKLAKKRAGQMVVNRKEGPSEDEVPVIAANTRTSPGIITQRGCCYAGCKGVVLGPTRDIIKVDADSRNIEELSISASPQEFRPEQQAHKTALTEKGFEFSDYAGMMPEMDKETLVIDDISEHETEMLLRKVKPDIFCAGIKEKYGVQKFGIPCKQLHSYDYGGPYAGFKGAVNFWKDIDVMINASVWKHLKAPWKH
jgi:nitrogenase molybdenum-iron protein alpha/beta subunit